MDAEIEDNDLVESSAEIIGGEVKDSNTIPEDCIPRSEDTVKDENVSSAEKVSSDTTESKGVQNLSHKAESIQETTRSTDQVFENGKRKVKEEKPSTKVVVRRLPPLMTKDTFLEQVSPLPPYDYMYFVCGDPSYGLHSFSRAYINFMNQEDVFTFTRTFDNYVFLDTKGQEYPAIVEFSPFQRVPKQRSKKKDTLTGTIESDPMYITFKENLLAEALENSKAGAKTMKQHYFETEISRTEEINTTPLLEYLKQKRAEKARIRDERREEKKRKDAERKLKQKTKDKKVDGEEEETAKDVKVLQSKERRDSKDKDLKITKKKEEKEKLLKENRTREFKNRSGKSYQEERIRQAERREERKKETNCVTFERKSESQCTDGKDAETLEDPSIQEEKGNLFIEKKKIYENKKKGDTDDWKIDGEVEKRIKTDRNRSERRQRERERKRREEFANRKGYEKKHSDSMDKRKPKTYKSISSDCINETSDRANKVSSQTKETVDEAQGQRETKATNEANEIIKNEENNDNIFSQRRKSLESGDVIEDKIETSNSLANSKRRNSLESVSTNAEGKFKLKKSEKRREHSKIQNSELLSYKYDKEQSTISNEVFIKKSKHPNSSENQNEDCKLQNTDLIRDESKIDESNKNFDGKTKNSETGNSADMNNSTRSKDPRTDRRIRNKDRPSLQIYRPGMGKFSKQRLEKEKVLGSSTEVESPSHSPSPTPKLKFSP